MGSLLEIADPPIRTITSLRWSRDGYHPLVGAWDSKLRVYTRKPENFSELVLNTTSDELLTSPLDVCWGKAGSSVIFAVYLGGAVFKYDFVRPVSEKWHLLLSVHEEAAFKVAYSPQHNLLISVGTTASMHVHDPDSKAYIRIKLSNKPFALSLSEERAVVAMAERKVSVFELDALRTLLDQKGSTAEDADQLEVQPWQERDSSLKFMVRDVACMPDGSGFAISSIEGRVGVEWFDPALQQNTYAFKCHRQTHMYKDNDRGEEAIDVVYPVNALAFHPSFGTFATGGGDGVVALWDAKTKRRVKLYHRHDNSVEALDISPDGKFLAIGVGPSLEESRIAVRQAEGKDALEDEDRDREVTDAYYENFDISRVKIFVREFAEGEAKAKEKKEKKESKQQG